MLGTLRPTLRLWCRRGRGRPRAVGAGRVASGGGSPRRASGGKRPKGDVLAGHSAPWRPPRRAHLRSRMPVAGCAPRSVQRRKCRSPCGLAMVPTPVGGDGVLDRRGRSGGRSHRHRRRNTPTGVDGRCGQRRRGGLPRRACGSPCKGARRDSKDMIMARVPDAVVMPLP